MSRRILVVDDDRDMVRTLCDILRLRGWDTRGAHSGEEAVAAEREEPFSAVLMDIRMSGIDGIAAFKEMRVHSPDLRVVLMTAHTAPDALVEARQRGAHDVLSKPVDLGTLLSLLG